MGWARSTWDGESTEYLAIGQHGVPSTKETNLSAVGVGVLTEASDAGAALSEALAGSPAALFGDPGAAVYGAPECHEVRNGDGVWKTAREVSSNSCSGPPFLSMRAMGGVSTELQGWSEHGLLRMGVSTEYLGWGENGVP